jgi:hypothetical protein
MNQNQAIQAVTIAAAHTVDRYTVPNDVTYLVLNGIDPDEAAQRVIAHRRRMAVWGFAVAASLLWIGVLLGWAVHIVVSSIGGLLLGRSVDPLQLYGGGVSAVIGTAWLYVLAMSAVWSWRHTARGCAWEDSRSPWLPSRRPRSGTGAPVAPAEGRTGPLLISVVGLVLISGFVVAPVLGGFVSAITDLLAL